MKSRLEEIYNEFGRDGDRNYDWEKQVYALAKRYPQEYQMLLRLFNQEPITHFKIELAKILSKLGEKQILPYLLDVVQNNKEYLTYPYSAAQCLIRLGHQLPVSLYEHFLNDGIPPTWIKPSLLEINSEYSLALLKELFNRNEKMANLQQYLTPQEREAIDNATIKPLE